MANLIGAAYKWRIDNNVYSYITNTEGGDPFVVSGSTKCNEELIRNKVQNFTQEQYETKFQEMVSAVHAYDNGKYSYVQFLDYTIYMNECEHCDIYNRPDLVTDIDFTVSSTTLPSDSEATVGIHTTDNDIEYREGEKTRKYHINFGIPKGSRFIPIRVTDEELLQNGEQIIRDNDILAGDFVISVDSTTIWSCAKDYQFINSGIQLNKSTYRYFADINAYSFGEGDSAEGVNSITEGGRTKTIGQYTHAEGKDTTAQGEASHAEGLGFDEANGDEKKAIIKRLNNTDKLNVKNTYGIDAEWVQPTNALVDGKLYDIYTADGKDKLCSMTASLFDQHHLVFNKYGGNGTWNRTGALFSVDNDSVLSDGATYVFKRRYGAFGSASHTEGVNAFAYGDNSHAEGDNSMAIGKNSHAEGSLGGAYGNNSHVEGAANTANGSNSHAEGRANTASGKASHAEGDTTLAIGDYSHAEGFGNVAKNKGHHVSGTYAEIDNTGNAIFQVGIGDDDSTRRDAFRINKDGSFVFAVPENMDAPIFTFHPNIAQQEASAINEDEGEGDSVQTYNMRRSAPRQTSVSVTTSNFLDLINLQDNINNAIDGILPGIEEDLSNLRNNFDDIIDEQEQNYNETIAEILIKTSDIQSQIDGEATAWFFKGAPCDEWGTIDENKEPAKDWNKDGTNGKESYASHKGDTYTDITEKENGEIGKSWRFCYCERKIGAGENQKTTDWHWHEIGDASVARALYEASRAQSTADGKSTVYISKDENGNRVPDHYQAGDMWIINETALEYGEFDHDEEKNIYYTKEINEDGEVQRGTPISVGEMLTSNANSKEYRPEHWSKEIKYTDDSYIIEAKRATQEAYAAAEERHKEALQALEKLNEIGRDGRVYATEFDFLNSQIGVISGDTNELVGADGTQGEASLCEGMVDSADEYFNAANSAKTALEYYTNEENFDIDANYIQIRYENYYNWKYITHYYIARQELLNDIADASKNYSSGIQGISNLAALNASAAQNAADEAAEGASAALGMLDDVDNDNVVAITEFAALESELEVIERDLIEISNSIKLYEESDLYGKLSGDTAEYEITGTPVTYKGYTAYQTAQIKAVNALKYHCGKTVESDGVSITAGERKDDKNEFGSIKIRSPKEGMNNETTILGVDVNYENIVDYYGIRQSMLDHIAFVAKLYAESLQPDLSPENVAVILGQINMDGVNLITGSRCDFAMSQWDSTNKLTIKSEVNNYTETQINEDSKLSFCTCLYHPDPDPDKNVDVITNKQWEGEYISASIDVFIPKDNVTEEDKKNPKKVNFGIVLRSYDEKGNSINLFSAYATNIACVYNDWTRLKLTFHMEKDITDVFTKDGKEYIVSHVYLVVYDADSTYKFTTGTKFKFRKIQIEFNTSCSSWYPSPEDVDEIYSVAVDAQTNANAAKKEAEASMNILTDMSDDGKLTPQEKVNIIKEWGEIQEEYEQASIDVKSVWEDHGFQQPDECTEYFDIYNVLNGYLGTGYTGDKYTIDGNCDINLSGVTTDISGHTITINNEVYTGKNCFNKVFSTYYTKHVAYMNCLAEQLAYLEVRSIEIGAVNLLDGTETMSGWTPSGYSGATITKTSVDITSNGKPATKIVSDGGTDKYKVIYTLLPSSKVDFDREYTLSFDVEGIDYTLCTWAKLAKVKGDSTHGANSVSISPGTSKRVSFTGYPYPNADLQLWFGATDTTSERYGYDAIFKIKNLKLEFGSVATEWTPSLNDSAGYIEEIRGYTDSIKNSLQSQIDGVVDSYFMEGEPTTSNKPASDWNENGDSGKDPYAQHEGDTYTDISEITLLNSSMWEQGSLTKLEKRYQGVSYNNQKTTNDGRFRTKVLMDNKPGQHVYVPEGYHLCAMYYNTNGLYLGTYSDNTNNFILPGYDSTGQQIYKIAFLVYKSNTTNLSYKLADELKLCINPSAGQSWRWCRGNANGENIGWHWHKIADSDAVKALQVAAAAQDTADSKRRVFTDQPYTPYDVGDLWVKADDNNSSLNDTLYCQSAKTSGDFDSRHWVSSTAALAAMDTANSASTVASEALDTANSALTASSGVSFLTQVMESGATETKGGLFLTNVLALRDINNETVTGGMSGVINDKVLLWGGETYENAVSAAQSSNYVPSGKTTPITTLIKKDGTGKIGVFKISDTQAVVDVPGQGKVVIDASDGSGGIRVLNSSGKINAAILPSSIESYKPKQTTSTTTTGSKTHSGISSENDNVRGSSVTFTLGSVTTYPPSTSEEETVTYTKHITNTPLTCSNISVQDPINISGSVTRVYSGTSQTGFDETDVTVRCSLRVNGTEVKGGSVTKTFASSSSSVTFFKNIVPIGTTKPSLNFGTNTVTMVVTVTLASTPRAGKLDTINLKVTGGRTIISYSCTTRTEYWYQPMTIIGNDGLVSLVNQNKYFMVDNSGSTQKIYAKGLSTTKGTAGSGELYVTSDFIESFKAFVTKAKELFAAARYTGDNGDFRDSANTECDNILNKLNTTSIIANS